METPHPIPMYFKITNQDETHYGHKYHTGLNILSGIFQETGSCVSGGLYYTDLEHVTEFFSYGIYLREVFLPESDPDFICVKDGSNKWRANKIILGERYSLFDLDTYNKFGLDPGQNRTIVDKASEVGNIDFLDWWARSGSTLPY